MIKISGPSLKDKAAVGNAKAVERLRQIRLENQRKLQHPNPLGSLNEQKAYLRQQGLRNLSKLSPEQRRKFWDDATKFQANVTRGRAMVGSFLPGLGLLGGASVLGAGETGASLIEGRSPGNALARGAGTTAAGATAGFAANKAISALYRGIVGKALQLNAKDPYHKKWITRMFNPKSRTTAPGNEESLYLTHAAGLPADGVGTTGRTPSGLGFLGNDAVYRPSMGLTANDFLKLYSGGYSSGYKPELPVQFFFGKQSLTAPRTVVFESPDAFTPVLATMRRELGSRISDPISREAYYAKMFGRTIGNSESQPVINLEKAHELLAKTKGMDGAHGRAFEVKPYRDVSLKEVKAVSIGLPNAASADPFKIPGVRKLIQQAVRRKIPYYFTHGALPVKGSPEYVMPLEQMANDFAPKL